MVFIFSFLAILRERHSVYMRDCVDAIYRIDGELELKLRRRTEDSIGNEDCVVPAARVNVIQRAINYYADVVGTLVGVAILIIVIMVVSRMIGTAVTRNTCLPRGVLACSKHPSVHLRHADRAHHS